MTGKSPSINSKFKLSYQFLLKIMNNEQHNLNVFMNSSLLSQDNLDQIENMKKERDLIKQKIQLIYLNPI